MVIEIWKPRKKSRIWFYAFPKPKMATCAHDIAALCIKGDLAILNFTKLAESLPQQMSLAPCNVQVVVTKATQMDKFDSTSLSSSSLPFGVS
ncbi:hypothetical protein V6N13_029132 [Hibiscus sabdariffa]|uniref:Uncharacterized protein n=2 Tax=Hibiscus sabdariffa TaxID=183260 RepID=A0ABR2TBM4_9ROSI